MNRAERLHSILDLLAEQGHVEIEQIVESLDVSTATARRDLDLLASQQLLTRTHGGARGHSVAYDLPIRYKVDHRSGEKRLIAEAASSLVEAGDVVGLSGGTTSSTIATVLAERADLMEQNDHPNLTVVTNAVNIAAQLAVRPQIKVVITGGVVQSRSYEVIGPFADAVLTNISMNIAFIGVNGIDPEFGASVHDESEASVILLMARRADRAIAVADSSKISHRLFASVGEPATFQTLITDSGITQEQLDAFAANGIEVIVADADARN